MLLLIGQGKFHKTSQGEAGVRVPYPSAAEAVPERRKRQMQILTAFGTTGVRLGASPVCSSFITTAPTIWLKTKP
jgi:hypothetical protein